MLAPAQRRLRFTQPQVHQLMTVRPPVMGLNTVDSIAEMPPTDALEMDNLISTEQGVTVRNGWFEYATNIGGGTTHQVRTIMSYDGAPSNALVNPLASSILFCATDQGIYDVEAGGNMNAIAPEIALSGASGAGTMHCVEFTAAGGGQYLVACSETDGGFIFDGLVWKKMTSTGGPGPGVITGVDPANFVHVCVWKKRLMFTQRSSAQVWILSVGAVGGGAVLFDFGPQLLSGGMVLGLANWTQDAGAGIDDRLAIFGSSGDLVIYEGTDPTDATKFSNVGTWYIGQPPIGRRCFTHSGGNVFALTQFGVVPVAAIVQGGLDNVLTSDTQMLKQLRKLQGALNIDFKTLLNTQGWEINWLPSLALLQIARPRQAENENIQYVFQMHSMAWSRILDMPGTTFARRLNEVYAGTSDGRVLRVFVVNTDGLKLDGTGSYEIRSRLTPAFSYFGGPTVRKQALMMRINFLSTAQPTYSFLMNVDFSLNPIYQSATTSGKTLGSLWDASFWDQDFWSGGAASFGEWRSTVALGFALAPSVFISSLDRTTIANIEYMVKPGGPL